MQNHEEKFEAAWDAVHELRLLINDTSDLNDVADVLAHLAPIAEELWGTVVNCRQRQQNITPHSQISSEAHLRTKHSEHLLEAVQSLLTDAARELHGYIKEQRAAELMKRAAVPSSPEA